MKRVLFVICLMIGCHLGTQAQWTTAGDGTTYTLRDLVEASESCVTYVDTLAAYCLFSDLTIAAGDCLTVVPSDCQTETMDALGIQSKGDILITVKGSIRIDNEDMKVYVGPVTGSRLQIRFENSSSPSLIANCNFLFLSGIQLIESEVTFKDCLFQSFDKDLNSGAITYMNCNPVLHRCIFQGNYGSAISSGVNVTGSPQLYGCEFRYNVLSKENMPQLNLGPGGEDTIRIVGNRVIGLYPLVGGIVIADLLNVGDTKVLLKDNFIADNRYGYNQQGYTIDAVIEHNEFVCNNIDNDPMQGGSGISIYGTTSNCKAKLRNNLIKDNLWGITVIANATVDLGTAEDPGRNIIFGNHNTGYGSDQEYALYVNGTNDVDAVGNYWGGDNEAFAESVIFHRPDLGESYGLVTYSPIQFVNDWSVASVEAVAVSAYPNPTKGLVTLCVAQDEGFSYEVYNPMGQQVMKGQVTGQETVLDLSSCAQGIYLIAITPKSTGIPIIERIIR